MNIKDVLVSATKPLPQGPQKEPEVSALPFGAPRRPRVMSEAAAAAAQHVDDLERELAVAQQQVSTHASHITVLEESNHILHEEIEKLKLENERLLRENTVIRTRIEMSANILVNIMKPIESQEASPAQVEKLEHTLSEQAPTVPAAPDRT